MAVAGRDEELQQPNPFLHAVAMAVMVVVETDANVNLTTARHPQTQLLCTRYVQGIVPAFVTCPRAYAFTEMTEGPQQ